MAIDYKQYPPNWKTEIRPAVLARAGNKCEWCGVLNESIIYRYGKGKDDWIYVFEQTINKRIIPDGKKVTKIVLTIAHLDHDKLNHDVSLDRLAALCQKCHLGHDIKRHVSNKKYGIGHRENNL